MIQRNHLIDSLKFLCALLVVFIHCEYPYKAEVLPITDVAVPIFFASSGYFIFGTKRRCERVVRIGKIFLWAAALYLLKTEFFQYISSGNLWIPTSKNLINFILFNDVAFSYHLWYLSAYVYVLIITFVIDKYNIWRWALWTIVPLLMIGVFIKYNIADVCSQNIQYYRNAYFNGLPYFFVGVLVKNPPPLPKDSIKTVRLILSVLIFVLFILRYNLIGNSLDILMLKELDLFLLTYFIVLLATISLQKKENIISILGSKYSLYIYIFHVLIMQVCEILATQLPIGIKEAYMYINPFVVLASSIVLTYLLGKFKIIKL